MATEKTHRVSDIYGDQIQVDGAWFHAELIFGKSASLYAVGDVVQQLAVQSKQLARMEPDEWVSCELYRGCASNEMQGHKVSTFTEVMLLASGWGQFPMISGYIETVDAGDVSECERWVSQGQTKVWLSELGWSRVITRADIGTRYVHIDNGHHRMAAASIASATIGQILAPVADRKREEGQPRFT